jgi:hypothetical protein
VPQVSSRNRMLRRKMWRNRSAFLSNRNRPTDVREKIKDISEIQRYKMMSAGIVSSHSKNRTARIESGLAGR